MVCRSEVYVHQEARDGDAEAATAEWNLFLFLSSSNRVLFSLSFFSFYLSIHLSTPLAFLLRKERKEEIRGDLTESSPCISSFVHLKENFSLFSHTPKRCIATSSI